MTDIPDDIMQTVGKILGKPEYSVRAANYDAVSLKLALALMGERESATKAERERGGKIANDYAEDSWGMTEEESAAQNIATAILSGARP